MGGITLDNIEKNPIEDSDVITDDFSKMVRKSDYDGLIEPSIKLSYKYGECCSELLHKFLNIAYSRCDAIILQMNDIGILTKHKSKVMYSIVPQKVLFDKEYMYIYSQNDTLDVINSFKYELSEAEYLMIENDIDNKLHTKKFYLGMLDQFFIQFERDVKGYKFLFN